jgi:hypothetical protein
VRALNLAQSISGAFSALRSPSGGDASAAGGPGGGTRGASGGLAAVAEGGFRGGACAGNVLKGPLLLNAIAASHAMTFTNGWQLLNHLLKRHSSIYC